MRAAAKAACIFKKPISQEMRGAVLQGMQKEEVQVIDVESDYQQHGDVLVFRINALPQGLKRQAPKDGRIVLAEGEATGHAHVIAALEDCDLYADEDGILYLEVRAEVDLTHEEHATQTIAPGVYRVDRVREVDPFENEIHAVRD